MKEFIARFGYVFLYVFGEHKYTLEEKINEYFRFGLTMIIVMTLLTISLLCRIIFLFIKYKTGQE